MTTTLTDNPTTPLVDVKVAAELLGISVPVVYRLIRRKELPAVRIGGHTRLHQSVVMDAYRFGTRPNESRKYTPRKPKAVADVADAE